MDPFRDELAAAHGKIAQLEEEVRRLKGDHYPPPPPDLLRRQERERALFVGLLAIIGIVLVGAIAASVVLFARPAAAPTTSTPAVFSGVAIAPTAPAVVGAHPSQQDRTLDSANPYKGDKKCNCSPGDPLCSCL